MEANRILLKLSGEALAGDKHQGFDEKTVLEVARQVKGAIEEGKQVAIVIGGGNFWRGRTSGKSETVQRTGRGADCTATAFRRSGSPEESRKPDR